MQARIRATLDKQRADVSAMFDALAPRYDLLNDILSLGSDRGWRRATTAAVAPGPGEHILDLAGGTGASSLPFLDAGAHVFPTDLSLGMLTVGKQAHPQLCFVAGDALQLPFADDSFDAVTISYGLRNVQDTAAALREMLRVTRPGGRLVIAEFSTPSNPVWRFLYQQGALRAVPLMAKISPNPVAYGYLAESIVAWPAQAQLADLMHQIGWRDIEWQDLTGGIVALHRAWKR